MKGLWTAVFLVSISQCCISCGLWVIFNMIEPFVVCWLHNSKALSSATQQLNSTSTNVPLANCSNAYDLFATHQLQDVMVTWTMIRSMFGWAGILGGLFAQPICDRYGRKFAILTSGIVNLVTCVVLAALPHLGLAYEINVALLVVTRSLQGLNSSTATVVVITYLVEIAPIEKKGLIGNCYYLFSMLNMLVVSFFQLDFMLGTADLWSLNFLIQMVFGSLPVFLVSLYPESPTYYETNGLIELAKETYAQLHGQYWRELVAFTQDETNEEDEAEPPLQKTNHLKLYKDCFNDKPVRSSVYISICCFTFYMLSGIPMFLSTHTLTILSAIGLDHQTVQYMIVAMFGLRLIASYFSGFLIERLGRKKAVMAGFLVGAFFLTSLAMDSERTAEANEKYGSVAALAGIYVCVVALVFACSWISTVYVICSEILPPRYKAIGNSVGQITNYVNIGVVSWLYPFLLENFGEFTFLFFAGVAALASVYVYVFIPETKNLTSEQLMEQVSIGIDRRREKVQSVKKWLMK